MQISNFAIIPFFIASFVMLAFLYYRISPDRRVLNLHFGLMAGAVVLMLAPIFLTGGPFSLIFFALALFWFGLSIYLLRHAPPPRH